MDNEKKEIAYYATMVNAWIQTRMERDKTLVSLSAGGIGLLVFIAIFIGTQNFFQVGLCCVAFLDFVLTIGIILYVFQRNSEHLEKIITNKEGTNRDNVLIMCDKLSFGTFIAGAVLFVVVVIMVFIRGVK